MADENIFFERSSPTLVDAGIAFGRIRFQYASGQIDSIVRKR